MVLRLRFFAYSMFHKYDFGIYSFRAGAKARCFYPKLFMKHAVEVPVLNNTLSASTFY